MSGAATFNLVFMVLGLLISVAVPLIIGLGLRRLMLRGQAASTGTMQAPRGRSHWKWLGLIPLVGVSLFCGLMVASVGGALYPPLTKVSAALACDGEFSIKTSQYSYKPGQQGTTYQTLCVDRASGEVKDVSIGSFLWNSLIFAGVAFLPLLVASLILLRLLRRLFASLKASGLARSSAGTGGTLSDRFEHRFDNTARAPPSASDRRSIEDRLRELLRLRERGLIDDSDFQTRKAQILSQL